MARLKGNVLIMQTLPRTQPETEHVEVYRKAYWLHANEELHAIRDDAKWLLVLADAEADEYPAHVTENSRTDALAIIAAVDTVLNWRASKGISKPVSPLGYDRAFLDTLKAAVRVEDEIARAVLLTRRGTSLRGLCPFHDDQRPSLVVWPERGRWKCFPCDLGGDVFTWLQAYNRMTFAESVRYLAAITGVAMPTKATRHPVTIRERGAA